MPTSRPPRSGSPPSGTTSPPSARSRSCSRSGSGPFERRRPSLATGSPSWGPRDRTTSPSCHRCHSLRSRRAWRSRRSDAIARPWTRGGRGCETERDEASAHDPQQLRAELEEAEAARAAAEQAAARADERATEAADERDAAAAAERAAASREAEINKSWRDASTELDRLRETYEEDDRLRGDIERRVRDAERLLREGHGLEPESALAMLTGDDSVPSLEKASELVQRRLGLLGRVNLLATGEFEVVQERHDFMQRELDDIRKARRDLLELVAQVDTRSRRRSTPRSATSRRSSSDW